MIKVLLVDDQPLVRAGLRRILSPQDELTVVGECDDGDQVLDAVTRHRPDVVVMDVRMRRVDGTEATRLLRDRPGSPPVLVLTTFDDDETVAAALGAGAAGFILKDAPGEDIVRATTTVAEGRAWLDPQVAGHVLAAYRRVAPGHRRDASMIGRLTQRELDVLAQVGRGATNAEAAAALHVSEATVKTHLGRLLAKLDLRDRAALIVFAQTNGLA
ncbi:response regulator transcription factor [Spongiactinospora sp. TRM90649]|uniref:response regulator transcription factor n=1 Tax=Spongiactinospora sp. TRM90649 TaxID=3031114 RepID=UPI0023F7DE05|nr:response regulator transcription factor [Spongiactinospora sp. TRM90649]MDF5754018.1 response regulator transcription factor [Spongiactinospora sp. TRM90649]